jgi:hypothetical protein
MPERLDYTYTEWAIVENVSSTGAICKTSYGAEITIDWKSGKPDPLPRANETWLVCHYFINSWRFLSKLEPGVLNQTRFALMVDCETCYGAVRPVVEDIQKSQFDAVYLRVAGNGIVMWDSDAASGLGLSCPGDIVTEMVQRLNDYSIPVTFVIDCDLWSDTSSQTHNAYEQVIADGSGSRSYSKMLSPAGAATAMQTLVDELYKNYSTTVRGVCFRGFGMDGMGADFSPASVNGYVGQYKLRPDESMATYGTVSTWWDDRKDWDDWLAMSEKSFLTTVRENVSTWPISMIASDSLMCIGDGTHRLGRLACGIPDDIGKYGWSRVGMPIKLSRQADYAAEMREFELMVAYVRRLAQGSVSLPVVSLSSMKEFTGPLEILSSYGVGDVLFSDYDEWRKMTDDQVIALDSAMGTYRVTAAPTNGTVGLVISSDSHDYSRRTVEEQVAYAHALSNVASEIIDGVPQMLQVLFDSDLAVLPIGFDAICLFDVVCMSDASYEVVRRMEDSTGTVLIGSCGTHVGRYDALREEPFLADFSLVTYKDEAYTGEIAVNAGILGAYQTSYALTSSVTGDNAKAGGKAVSGTSMVPLATKGRSSMFAVDVADDDMTRFVVACMVRKAVGSVS